MLGGGGLGGGGGDGGGGAHTLGRWRLGGSAALSPDPLGRSALATTPTTAQSSLGKWQSPDLLRWPPERSSTPRSRCASRKIPLQASSRIVSRLTKKMKWQRERTRGIWTGRSMIPNSNHCAAPLALPHLAPPHLARLQQSRRVDLLKAKPARRWRSREAAAQRPEPGASENEGDGLEKWRTSPSVPAGIAAP